MRTFPRGTRVSRPEGGSSSGCSCPTAATASRLRRARRKAEYGFCRAPLLRKPSGPRRHPHRARAPARCPARRHPHPGPPADRLTTVPAVESGVVPRHGSCRSVRCGALDATRTVRACASPSRIHPHEGRAARSSRCPVVAFAAVVPLDVCDVAAMSRRPCHCDGRRPTPARFVGRPRASTRSTASVVGWLEERRAAV